MNLCETCKHWERYTRPRENDVFDNAGEAFDKAGLVLQDHGSCAMAYNPYDDRHAARPRETLAWAEDGEEYVAALVTHKTFGCVQWQRPVAG